MENLQRKLTKEISDIMAVKTLIQSIASGGSVTDDSILHSPTVPVHEMTNEIRMIIQDLKDTLWVYPFCRGLSAPQIGYSYSISVINIKRESPDNDLVFINPKIVKASGKKDKKRESCMSVWGKMGEVERRDKIDITYQNEDLKLIYASYTGFLSRAIQHEIDHLSGILYSDKIVPGTELQTADFFDRFSIIEG